MAKQELSGTLEEQCAFLYALAHEKMAQGNFTGAVHALKEVVEHAPDFRDAQMLLAEAKARKSEQTRLLIMALLSAALFVGVGSAWQLANDWWLWLLAVVGALVGFVIGNFAILRQRRRSDTDR